MSTGASTLPKFTSLKCERKTPGLDVERHRGLPLDDVFEPDDGMQALQRAGDRRGRGGKIIPLVLRAQLQVDAVEEMDAPVDLDGILRLVDAAIIDVAAVARAVETLDQKPAVSDVARIDFESVERRGRIIGDVERISFFGRRVVGGGGHGGEQPAGGQETKRG